MSVRELIGYLPWVRVPRVSVSMVIPRELRLGAILKVSLYVALAASMALFCVWVRMEVVHLTYQINALEKVKVARQLEGQRLAMKHLALKNPKRIERVARRLKLQFPKKEQIIFSIKE